MIYKLYGSLSNYTKYGDVSFCFLDVKSLEGVDAGDLSLCLFERDIFSGVASISNFITLFRFSLFRDKYDFFFIFEVSENYKIILKAQ